MSTCGISDLKQFHGCKRTIRAKDARMITLSIIAGLIILLLVILMIANDKMLKSRVAFAIPALGSIFAVLSIQLGQLYMFSIIMSIVSAPVAAIAGFAALMERLKKRNCMDTLKLFALSALMVAACASCIMLINIAGGLNACVEDGALSISETKLYSYIP